MQKVIITSAKSSFSSLVILVTIFFSVIGAIVPVHAQDEIALEEVVVVVHTWWWRHRRRQYVRCDCSSQALIASQ